MTGLPLDEIRRRVASVEATKKRIASMSATRRVEALAEAARRLLDPERELGRSLRTELERTSGLSSEGIAWALDTTLGSLTEEALVQPLGRASRAASPGRFLPRGLCTMVLSANVGTSPFTAIAMPLLFGNATVVKASGRDDVAARALLAALTTVDAELAESLDVFTFEGGDAAREDLLLQRSDAVVVYGSDATVATLRSRTPVSASFVAHGHGLGVGYVAASAVANAADERKAIDAFALDIAAYDQRGCLSPHLIAVQGGSVEARAFAEALSEIGLAKLERTMPRGRLEAAEGAAQMAWRGVAVARGELFEGRAHAASAEPGGPPRPSCGGRNVQVIAVDGVASLVETLEPLGVHLKLIGVAGGETIERAIAEALVPPLAPRVVPAGTMQTPAFGAPWDGELPFTGLVRYAGPS